MKTKQDPQSGSGGEPAVGRPALDADARETVHAPVVDALNAIIVRSAIGFAIVAGAAAVPIIFKLDPAIHEAFHLALPVAGVLYAASVWVLIGRRPLIEGDPWQHADEVDPGLTRLARLTSSAMLVGWLAAVAAVLVNHHLTSMLATVGTLFIDVPLIGGVWVIAAAAWRRTCRVLLARAEHLAADRLRAYWRTVARP